MPTDADLLAALLKTLEVQTTALDRIQALLLDYMSILDAMKRGLGERRQTRERILSPYGEIDACSD